MYKINLSYLYLFTLAFITIVLRLYNINYDDFWIDEILSFYIADPSIPINEFYERHKTLENSPFLFNFILRTYFKIAGYDVAFARYFPASLNILAVFMLIYFYNKFLNGKSLILLFTLVAFNIYTIKYSQELRLYSWYIFIYVINLIYFYEVIFPKKSISNLSYYIFFISSLLLILTHPFSLIIIMSYNVYILIFYILKKHISSVIFKILILLNIFSFFFLIFFLLNTTHQPIWIEDIDWKFFTNFFFSKFFGSRLVGGVYLAIFLYLIFKFLKNISLKPGLELFLLISIFFSYAIPILYSYLFKPAVVDRYLIYLVLSVILLLVLLINKLKSDKQKYFFSSLLIICTLGNFTTESTFKQFYKERNIHKPDLKSVFEEINSSTNLNVSLNLEETYLSKNKIHKAFENYLKKYKKIDNRKIVFFNYLESEKKVIPEKFWLICLSDLNGKNCSLPGLLDNYEEISNSSYNSINLKLISKKN